MQDWKILEIGKQLKSHWIKLQQQATVMNTCWNNNDDHWIILMLFPN